MPAPRHPRAARADHPTPGPTAPGLEVPAPTAGPPRPPACPPGPQPERLGEGLLALLSSDSISEQDWEDVETLLLQADLGVAPTDRAGRAPAHPGPRRGHRRPGPRARHARRGAAGPRRPHDGPHPRHAATRAARRSSSWSASTAPARRPRPASSPAC